MLSSSIAFLQQAVSMAASLIKQLLDVQTRLFENCRTQVARLERQDGRTYAAVNRCRRSRGAAATCFDNAIQPRHHLVRDRGTKWRIYNGPFDAAHSLMIRHQRHYIGFIETLLKRLMRM